MYRKSIKPKGKTEVPSSLLYTEKGREIVFLKLTGGTIVWHTKYNEPYIFLFWDNGVPKFADTDGRFYENLNDTYRLVAATPEQTASFWNKLKQSGYKYHNNKITKI